MKVAFIAMSGLRAFNPELTRLGWTLPGFMERSKVIASLPSLSLLTLAGMTPDHFEIEYHEVQDLRKLDTLPVCDLAAISSFTAQIKDAYALAGRYKEMGVPTVIGGLHVTALPQEALRHCDAVVVGEGELAWPRVLEDFEAGRLQRLYGSEDKEFDLAEAPMPRFELLDPQKYNRLPLQTQRGCPWRCNFCASSITLTHQYKIKSVERVLEELQAIKRIWPRPFIEFADDNTFVHKPHTKELMRVLAEEGVRWFTETDISVAEDEELLELIASAGCAQLLIGLESPTAIGLEGLELNRNWKRAQVKKYVSAIQRIQSYGITVNGCFILGLDGDNASVFDAVWDFVERSGLYEVQITVMTAFPGTPLYASLLHQGRLLDPEAWEKCTLFDVNFNPKHMSVSELEQGLIELGQRLYADEAKRERVRRFRRQLRAVRERRQHHGSPDSSRSD